MTSTNAPLPDSLDTAPVAALVPPGQCQFSNDFTEVELLERTQVSKTSSVLRFALPDRSKPLNLSTCACILVGAKVDQGGEVKENEDMVVRPYTPISTNKVVGHFDLLIKNYGDDAHMSPHLNAKMDVGDKVAFKHNPDANVKLQAPFQAKHIVMLVGGTGITPMIQALHSILGDEKQTNKVYMFYGSRVSDDILAKDLLDRWAKDCKDSQFVHLEHVLSHEPEDSSWTGARGHIDADMLKKNGVPGPAAGDDVMFFVCGPPPMYEALCGPREEKEKITGLLGDMGYKASQVYKF